MKCGCGARLGDTRNPYTVLGLRIGLEKVPFQMAVSGVAATVASHL